MDFGITQDQEVNKIMQQDNNTFRKRVLWLAIAVIILIVGYAIFAKIYNAHGNVVITFNLPDTDNLQVALNNKSLPISGLSSNHQLRAGRYTLKATKTGYDTFNTSFTVKSGQQQLISITMQRPAVNSDQDKAAMEKKLDQSFPNATITMAQFFYQNTWAFIKLQTPDGNNAMAIEQYDAKSQTWNTIQGPGTLFDQTILPNLPTDVQNYLLQNDYVVIGVTTQQ